MFAYFYNLAWHIRMFVSKTEFQVHSSCHTIIIYYISFYLHKSEGKQIQHLFILTTEHIAFLYAINIHLHYCFSCLKQKLAVQFCIWVIISWQNEWHHHGTCNKASFSFKHSNPFNIPTINQSDGLCITVEISL